MIDPKIAVELNELRKIVGEYADAAACLSRTINEVEDTIQGKNPPNDYVFSYVLNQVRLREYIRDNVYDFSKLDQDEANCWYCLLNVLKPEEDEL